MIPLAIPLAAGFITPAFALAGVGLVSIPVVIHLLNRRRYKTVPWAAMNFLLAAMKKNRRRLKFESWLLLLTRCACVALLGLALARPFGCADSSLAGLAGSRAALHVIVIDNSYSMNYEADRPEAKTHLDQAKRLAKSLLDRLGSGNDSVAVITAAAPAQAVISRGTFDLSAARDAIDRIEPTAADTDLPGALAAAVKVAAEDDRQPDRRLYLLTDDTAGAWRAAPESAFAAVAPQLAAGYRSVTIQDLGQPDEFNAAVLSVEPAEGLVRVGFPNPLVAVARGYGQAGRDVPVRWSIDGQPLPGNGEAANLTPQTPAITRSGVSFPTGGPHVITVALTADRLPVDDVRHRVVNVAADLKVLIVEGRRGTGPLSGSGAFLDLALAPPEDATAKQSRSYVAPERVSDLELSNKTLDEYRAVILAGVGSLTTPTADRLERFVRQGGTLILFAGDAIGADNYNSLLLPRGLLPGPLTQRKTATGPEGFHFDFKPEGNLPPILQSFRGLQKSGLDTAQIFTYWDVDLDPKRNVQRVLNYLPTTGATGQKTEGDPALTVQPLGEGKIVWFGTSADAEWTSLPGKNAYIPLVHELLRNTVTAGDRWMNLTAGQPLLVPPTIRQAGLPTLLDPQQSPVELTQQTADGGVITYRSAPLKVPGLYTYKTADASYPVAVNPPPAELAAATAGADTVTVEADVRRVDPAAVARLLEGVKLEFRDASVAPPEAATAGGVNDFGWSLLLAVLCLAAAECVMAMRFGHYRRLGG